MTGALPSGLALAQAGVAGVLIALGLLLLLAAALGLLRFPDFYTRIHAAKLAGAFAAPIVLLGLAVLGWEWRLALKLFVLALLLAGAAPLAAHMLASAAHGAGLAPIAAGETPPRRPPA